MNKKNKKKNGGAYLAICSCALIFALVGYAGRMSLKEKDEVETKDIVEITPEPVAYETAQDTTVEVPDENDGKEPEIVEKKESESIVFVAPVQGKVIEGYLGDDLVYNEALKDWRTHSGVDFEAVMGEEVRVSAKGVVESVFDSNMGRCVIVDHKNGYKTMYANLEEDTVIAEGDELKAGDVIGKVGNTALGDMTDLPHVHFEMMKDGNNVNPVDFIE